MKEKLAGRKEVPEDVRILTNIAFMMGDVTDTLLVLCQSRVEKFGYDLRREAKRRWNMFVESLKRTRLLAKVFSEYMYEIERVDDACDDSDYISEMVVLLCDRVGDNLEKRKELRNMLLSMPSEIGVYDTVKDMLKNDL